MIPKPPPVIPIEEDQRLKFLQEWKDLFEKVDPKIEVYIFKDDNSSEDKKFIEKHRELTREVRNWTSDFHNPRIIIKLRELKTRHSFFIGYERNRMFSNVEFILDIVTMNDNDILGCSPQTKKWSEFYTILCNEVSNQRKQIPPTP
jgi:hypothetical protein